MKHKILTSLLTLLYASTIMAKVTLPEIIGNDMVLQQSTQVKLWGKSLPNKQIEIVTSWNPHVVTTLSDKKGDWEISIATPKGSYTPHTIEISDGEKVTLSNILIGEVWLCSGQSNMEMPLKGYQNCPVAGGNETIATSGLWKQKIRFVNIPWTEKLTPQKSCPGRWKTSVPENAQWFSAIGFHFATMLCQVLDVPIGIIGCSWGGSTLEGWLPETVLKDYADIDLDKARKKQGMLCLRPMIMYNGMLHPLHRYTIKGVLWYQGESNVDKYEVYAERLATMVQLWRKEWDIQFPFYFAEIAPYRYEERLDAARFREAQYKAQFMIPSSGMICTNDLVEPYELGNIHPKNKKDVGQRFAYMALKETYGIRGFYSRGPEYKSMEVKDGKVILAFHHAEEGFSRLEGIQGFEMAGKDSIFYSAQVKVLYDECKLQLSSDKVTKPIAVRYCFHNSMLGNTGNQMELPIVPFRTDNW